MTGKLRAEPDDQGRILREGLARPHGCVEIGEDPPAHRVDVASEAGELRRTGRRDRVPQVAVGHPAHVSRQDRDRPSDPPSDEDDRGDGEEEGRGAPDEHQNAQLGLDVAQAPTITGDTPSTAAA